MILRWSRLKAGRPHLTGWLRQTLVALVILGLWGPAPAPGQTAPQVPVELKVTINDGKIKIGQVFVGELKKRLIRSQKFTFSASEPARLILRINCQEINELPFQSVVSIIWTAAVPGQGAPREIFLDYLLMVGVSAAHAGKDAEDVLHYTLTKILPRFRVLKKEKNLTRAPGFNAGKAFCKVRTAAHEDKLCIVPTEE